LEQESRGNGLLRHLPDLLIFSRVIDDALQRHYHFLPGPAIFHLLYKGSQGADDTEAADETERRAGQPANTVIGVAQGGDQLRDRRGIFSVGFDPVAMAMTCFRRWPRLFW
jgi:hypothetical protein